jgi:histidinol-phosphate aminotransferase
MNFNEELKDIKNYSAGKPIELVVREYGIKAKDVVKLASNENPYGTSPKVIKAVKEICNNMYLYPDDSMYELKAGLSKRFGIEDSNIIIGAGSDQILEFIVRAKSNKNSKVLMAKTTFAMYEIYAKAVGTKVLKTSSDTHNLDEFLEIYNNEKNIEIIFLCLPNNPLGESISTDEIYKFLEKISSDTLVVIDGAYQEYATFKDKSMKIDPSDIIKKFPNSIYLGTFSKAYGLGGMRVGYGIAKNEIISTLMKLRPPFNITTLSLKAAIEALKDDDFVLSSIKNNFKQMIRYEQFANDLSIKFIPSYTNFVTFLLKDSENSTDIANSLLKKGIIIRDLQSYGLNAVRITIGTKEENSKFFKTFLKTYNAG